MHNDIKSLLNVENILKESSEKIKTMIDTVWKHLQSLKTLTSTESFWESLIIYLITSKLDKVSMREWEQYKTINTLPTINELKFFIKQKADLLENLKSKTNDTESKICNIKKFSDRHKSSKAF